MNRYRPEILEQLAVFGIYPREHTPPAVARDFLKALYTMEIRSIRARQQQRERAGDTASRASYGTQVIELREKYAVLSIPIELWIE